MDAPSPLISVITVNFNGLSDTLEFIASLKKSTYKRWELFVVDNASSVDITSEVHQKHPDIHVIRSEENLGFAGGNNLALPHVNGSFLFYVNNDTIIAPKCLETLVNTAIKTPNIGAISPKFHFYHEDNIIEFAGCSKVNAITARNHALLNRTKDNGVNGLIKTHYAHGAGMLVPKKVLDQVGPMKNDYFLYYEELDWCQRIRKAGFDIYCQRDALIQHKESASVGKLNPMKTYYLNRNRILFMNRNFKFPKNIPFLIYFLLISFPTNIIRFTLKGEKTHLKAYLKGVFWHINHKYSY